MATSPVFLADEGGYRGQSAKYSMSSIFTLSTVWQKTSARLQRYLYADPDRLKAARVTSVLAVLVVPLCLVRQPYFAVTLALGALAGALSETDDHPKGRLEALVVKTVAFLFASTTVVLLNFSSPLLALGLGVSTVLCILVGGIGERYRGITFGTLLVALYTMIGMDNSPALYAQPCLLVLGSLIYGLFSLWLLRRNPWRLLDEQLARGFGALGEYFTTKAGLFPADTADQRIIRNKLAVINEQLVGQLDGCRSLITNYRDYDGDSSSLRFYLHCFMLLQSLHERAVSSHQRYDALSDERTHSELLSGIGAATGQLGAAIHQLGVSLLQARSFRYPVVLDWLIAGLRTELAKQHIPGDHPFHFIITNLAASAVSLYNMHDDRLRRLVPQLARDSRSRWQRFQAQLSWENGRMRYALRLAICFMAGFAIADLFDIAKGEWIVLTSLFVCQPSYGETRRKMPQRILGTLFGMIVGIALLQLLPTVAGKTVLLLAATCAFFLWLRRNYRVAVIFVTIIVLCAFDLMTGSGAAVMLPRLFDTVIGSVLALLSARLLWPEWQYKRLPHLLGEALNQSSNYLRVILAEYQRPPTVLDDDLEYRVARRRAHRADNGLVTAWRDMQVEPKKYRKSSGQAYRLTNLNHALLSFISAFGAHKAGHTVLETDVSLLAQEVLQFLEETARWSINGKAEEKAGMVKRAESLQQRLTGQMQSSRADEARQQLLLLRNICELTLAILETSDLLVAPG